MVIAMNTTTTEITRPGSAMVSKPVTEKLSTTPAGAGVAGVVVTAMVIGEGETTIGGVGAEMDVATSGYDLLQSEIS